MGLEELTFEVEGVVKVTLGAEIECAFGPGNLPRHVGFVKAKALWDGVRIRGVQGLFGFDFNTRTFRKDSLTNLISWAGVVYPSDRLIYEKATVEMGKIYSALLKGEHIRIKLNHLEDNGKGVAYSTTFTDETEYLRHIIGLQSFTPSKSY